MLHRYPGHTLLGHAFEEYIEPLVYCPDRARGSCAGMSYPEGAPSEGCIDTGNPSPQPGDEDEYLGQQECEDMWKVGGGDQEDAGSTSSTKGSARCDCGLWKSVSIALIVIICIAMLTGIFLYLRHRSKDKKVAPKPTAGTKSKQATLPAPSLSTSKV